MAKKKTSKPLLGNYTVGGAKKRGFHLVEANETKKKKIEVAKRKKEASKPAMEFPFPLDSFQNKAIGFVEKNLSVMVSAHTGKTIVKNDQSVAYISPISSICKRKYRKFKEEFADVGLMTGDVTIDPNASCLCLTRTSLLTGLLRYYPNHVRLLTRMIGTVPLRHFIYPIGGDLEEVVFLNRELVTDKEIKCQKGLVVGGTSEESDTIKMVKTIVTTKPDCFPVICFSFSERECQSLATEMAAMDLNEDFREKEFTETIFRSGTAMLPDKEFLQAATMLPLLKRGICVLHSSLLPILKDVIEVLFQKRLLKCLFATETFSIELNMQAKTVVFTNVRKVDGDKLRWITSREYMQISGRAGRRGIDDCGICILMVADTLELSTAKSMISGSADSLNSAFWLSYHTLLNQIQFEDGDPENLIRKSFHQFQSDRADTTDHEVKSSPSNRPTREIEESNSILEKLKIADSSVLALKEEFDARQKVLKKLKYTTLTDSVALKGKFASQISSADELTLTELMFRIKDFKVEKILSALSCFVWENYPELDSQKRLNEKLAPFFKKVQKIARNVANVQLNCNVQINVEDFVASFRPDAMNAIYALAKGSTLGELNMTPACEGPFIRGVTRLGKLLEQLNEAATITSELDLQGKLEKALNVITGVLHEQECATFWSKKFTRYSNGVTVEILKRGAGAEASGGKTIRVFYKAWLKDDDKKCIESTAFVFRLGTREVIRGFDFGVNQMRIGERRQLIIPPKWAHGSRGLAPLVPENAFLIFEVELLEVFDW